MTVYTWGELSTFTAATVDVLARMLYRRCPYWTVSSCDDIAQRLWRGVVVVVLDAEAVFLPGDFIVATCVPTDRPSWRPAAAGVGL